MHDIHIRALNFESFHARLPRQLVDVSSCLAALYQLLAFEAESPFPLLRCSLVLFVAIPVCGLDQVTASAFCEEQVRLQDCGGEEW